MVSNLIFYGSNLGLGILFSYYFWDTDKRSKAMIASSILIPILWTLILIAGKGTTNLIDLYDVEKMNYGFKKNRVTFWMVPMFWAIFAFGCIWIEVARFRNKK